MTHPQATPNDNPNPNEYCETFFCWDVYDVVTSDFIASGTYGYGSTVLGTAAVYYETKLNGGAATDKPIWFESTGTTTGLVFEGNRLYYSSAYPGGHPVSGNKEGFNGPRGTAVPDQRVYWASGYYSYENTVAIGSVAHQMTWNVPGYSGSWYIYGKGSRFRNIGSGTYHFGAPSDLGTSPASARWQIY
ncbi:MAG: hypothetical protein QOJ11_444 [Frankiales bacterium]|nr:hypothetical protein [Frankiales bacterium]